MSQPPMPSLIRSNTSIGDQVLGGGTPLFEDGLPPSARALARSWLEEGLDGASLVHGAVAVVRLVEGEGEVEDPAGVDLAVPDQVDELGEEAAHRRGAAVEVD